MLVVTTSEMSSFKGTARLFERSNAKAKWKAAGDEFSVVVGKNGLAWSTDAPPYGNGRPNPEKYFAPKTEGDGRSPAGMFPLTAAFGTASKPNAVELQYTKLDKHTECVDDVRSNCYNRIVNRMRVGNFDWRSSERMLDVGSEYDLGVFVAYNSYPVEKDRGSCIFLHIWKDSTTGTEGCTAMDRRDLERIVAWLSPEKNPYLIQYPTGVYTRSSKKWNLPKLK
jgi:D-alanyl-D-alanine dipeptidase